MLRVFSAEWFRWHQARLLRALNAPLVGARLRDVLGIDRGPRLVAVAPHYYIQALPDGRLRMDVRTHARFAKRLHHRAYPIWRLLHSWDMRTARLGSALNLGFDTLTVYPDPHTESTCVDGQVMQMTGDVDWATIRGGAGTHFNDTVAVENIVQYRYDPYGWDLLVRSIFLFDTSALTADATISAAVLSLYGSGSATTRSSACSVNIYTSAPASEVALAAGDFDSLGATAQCDTAIGQASWSASGYNAFTLNATGRGNISKTGRSKFGARDVAYDVGGATPSVLDEEARCQSYVAGYFADQTGTANDPKLVITYTPPTPPWVPRVTLF